MGLAAKPTLRTLCAGLKRANKAPDPLNINFTKSEMFVKSLSSYFFAHNEKQCNHLLLACSSPTQASYDRASGVRTSRHKKYATAFLQLVFFSVLAVALLLACLSTTQANYDRSAGDKLRRKKKDGIFLSSFSFGLVLSERFSAQTSRIPEGQYPLRS